MNNIEKLYQIIKNSNNIVLFTGAGISVPSGIPDFRSKGGLYDSGITEYGVSPEEVISHGFFLTYPKEFFDFYRKNLIFQNAKPNVAHEYFASLEKEGKLKAVITQNIDGLHEQAGSKNVLNVHGSIHDNYCLDCFERYPLSIVLKSKEIPTCEKCGGLVRPAVVLYDEALDTGVMERAKQAVEFADTLIVVGTSLIVQPAASLINYFAGKNLVLINLQKTQYDKYADLVINEPIEKVVENLEKQKGFE